MTVPYEREHCEQVLRRAAAEYEMNIQSLEVDEDHVHLYIAPQRSVGEGVTAAMVRRYIADHAEKDLEPAQIEISPKEAKPKKR